MTYEPYVELLLLLLLLLLQVVHVAGIQKCTWVCTVHIQGSVCRCGSGITKEPGGEPLTFNFKLPQLAGDNLGYNM